MQVENQESRSYSSQQKIRIDEKDENANHEECSHQFNDHKYWQSNQSEEEKKNVFHLAEWMKDHVTNDNQDKKIKSENFESDTRMHGVGWKSTGRENETAVSSNVNSR